MKKISYFGKEYTIGDDVKWVATCPSGNVIAFTEFPRLYCGTWVSHEDGKRIGIWGGATEDWENSLRKLEDIIVKENELRDGEFKIKCIDNKGNPWFKVGKVYKAWRGDYGALYSECELDNAYHGCDLNNGHGVFEMVEVSNSHPHADLMLKYAMIAQYDDEPWEHFEGQIRTAWYPMRNTPFYEGHNYRLKPQEPKIQIGQIWVSKEGVEVTVSNLANKLVFTKIEVGGLVIPWSYKREYFLKNFKLQENK